jgi:hypothetical protein
VWRLGPRELRIIPLVDGANLVADWARQLRQDKDAIEQASLAVKYADCQNRTENKNWSI